MWTRAAAKERVHVRENTNPCTRPLFAFISCFWTVSKLVSTNAPVGVHLNTCFFSTGVARVDSPRFSFILSEELSVSLHLLCSVTPVTTAVLSSDWSRDFPKSLISGCGFQLLLKGFDIWVRCLCCSVAQLNLTAALKWCEFLVKMARALGVYLKDAIIWETLLRLFILPTQKSA